MKQLMQAAAWCRADLARDGVPQGMRVAGTAGRPPLDTAAIIDIAMRLTR